MTKQSFKARASQNAKAGTQNAIATFNLINEAVQGYAESGDWTNMAWMIHYREGADKKRASDIIEAATGVTFRADPKQPTGLRKNKGDAGEKNSVALLAAYAELGVAFRSKMLEDGTADLAPLLVKKAGKVRTIEERAVAFVRAAIKDDPEHATDVRLLTAVKAAIEAELAKGGDA